MNSIKIDVVPLEHAENVPDERMATTMERLVIEGDRAAVLRAMRNIRAQMVFLLREYGFQPSEIAHGMRISIETVYKYDTQFHKLRQNLPK